jgi:hypothetical protein
MQATIKQIAKLRLDSVKDKTVFSPRAAEILIWRAI